MKRIMIVLALVCLGMALVFAPTKSASTANAPLYGGVMIARTGPHEGSILL